MHPRLYHCVLEVLEGRRLLSYTPVVPETQIEGNDSPSRFDLAVAGDGSYVVVSAQFNETTTTIIATRYSAGGQKVYLKIVDSGDWGGDVSVGADADGDAVVGYTLDLDKTTAGGEVYFKRVSKDGTLGSRTFIAGQTTTSADESVNSVNVAMDDGGDFYLAYIHDVTRSQHDVQMRFYDAAGNLQGSEFTAHSFWSPYSNLFDLDLVTNGAGSVAAYGAAFNISDDFETPIEFGRANASGPVGEVKQVANLIGPAHSTHVPVVHVLANDDGSALVAYDAEGGSWAQRYDTSGNPAGDPISLGSAKKPVIAGLSDGGFVAVVGQIATNYDASGAVQSDPHGVGGGLTTVIGTDDSDGLVLAYNKVAQGPVFVRTYSPSFSDAFASLSNSKLFVDGTSGGDTISITLEGSNIVAHRGNQSSAFAASLVTAVSIHSFGGNDTINNDTDLPSTIDSGDGNDTVFGGSSADRIYGGFGSDELWGGDGRDSIWGLDGADSIYGNGGNDRIEGGANSDHIRGNGGRDKLFGNGGNDRLYGGASGDWIYGQAGNDQILGEGGNDRLYSDDGSSDTLFGGAGDDVFITLDGVGDQLFGDGGRDSVTGDDADIRVSVEVRL